MSDQGKVWVVSALVGGFWSPRHLSHSLYHTGFRMRHMAHKEPAGAHDEVRALVAAGWDPARLGVDQVEFAADHMVLAK